MASYCDTGDLLLGNVPVPASAARYVQDAADEIDSVLGSQYVTPIILDENIPAQRSGFLLLKRINAHLASGRLIMALDAAGEDDQLHQYAEYLLRQALEALRQIQDGSIIIPGAEPINPEVNRATGPIASFADDYSPVEEYGTVFGNHAAQALEQPIPYYGPRSPYTW